MAISSASSSTSSSSVTGQGKLMDSSLRDYAAQRERAARSTGSGQGRLMLSRLQLPELHGCLNYRSGATGTSGSARGWHHGPTRNRRFSGAGTIVQTAVKFRQLQ